jgi:hypothetical protein
MQEVVTKSKRLGQVLDFRIDAGYTDGATLDYLTDEHLRFIGRLKSNAVLQRMAAPHLRRPVGRPPKEGYEEVIELGQYQAASWRHAQRLLLVVVDHPDRKTGQLNLLPEYFFLVVGSQESELDGPAALEHYRQRGTFEDRIGEFQQAIHVRLSHNDFAANEALLRLSLLAFNLASMLRIEYEAEAGSCFDLGRFQRDVLKAGARVVKGSRRLIVQVARVVAPFWERLVAAIGRWRLPDRFGTPRGSTAGNQLISAKASVLSGTTSELIKSARIRCRSSLRPASQRPPTTAPMPTVELSTARPSAPRSNTWSTKPGSSSITGRALTPITACSSRIGPIAGWAAV